MTERDVCECAWYYLSNTVPSHDVAGVGSWLSWLEREVCNYGDRVASPGHGDNI